MSDELRERVRAEARRRRQELHKTQPEAAGLAGLSARWWWGLEAGEVDPTLGEVERVAYALDTDPAALLGLANLDADMQRRQLLKLMGALAVFPTDFERLLSDRDYLDGFEVIVHDLAAQSYVLAPAAVLAPAEGQLAALRRCFVPGHVRAAELLSQSAALAGRVYVKLGRLGDAFDAYALALAAADEAGDRHGRAHVLTMQSVLYSTAALGPREGDTSRALALLESAAELLAGGPPQLAAHTLARRAEERAALGDRLGALRDLDLAASALSRPTGGRPYFGPRNLAELDAIKGNVELLLGDNDGAIVTLDRTLRRLSPQLVGWRAAVLTDQGAAHARAGALDAAVGSLSRALHLATQAGDHVARVRGTRERDLKRWAGERRVRLLDEQLSAVG